MYFSEEERTIAFFRILEIHDRGKVKNYCPEALAGVQNMHRVKLESSSFYKMCQHSQVPGQKHIKAKGESGNHK